MKTVLKIMAILCVAALVAGGISLVVNHTSLVSDSGGQRGAPPTMRSANGQSAGQLPTRSEGGDDHGASLAGGLPGVLAALAKLTGVIAVIVLAQNGLGRLTARRVAILSQPSS